MRSTSRRPHTCAVPGTGDDWQAVAERQSGTISHRQLIDAGLTAKEIKGLRRRSILRENAGTSRVPSGRCRANLASGPVGCHPRRPGGDCGIPSQRCGPASADQPTCDPTCVGSARLQRPVRRRRGSLRHRAARRPAALGTPPDHDGRPDDRRLRCPARSARPERAGRRRRWPQLVSAGRDLVGMASGRKGPWCGPPPGCTGPLRRRREAREREGSPSSATPPRLGAPAAGVPVRDP